MKIIVPLYTVFRAVDAIHEKPHWVREQGKTMHETGKHVACELYNRRAETIRVRMEQVRLDDWVPKRSSCHVNVARWIAANPHHKVAHGWLVEDLSQGECAAFYFSAHSVVEREDGSLGAICRGAGRRDFDAGEGNLGVDRRRG